MMEMERPGQLFPGLSTKEVRYRLHLAKSFGMAPDILMDLSIEGVLKAVEIVRPLRVEDRTVALVKWKRERREKAKAQDKSRRAIQL